MGRLVILAGGGPDGVVVQVRVGGGRPGKVCFQRRAVPYAACVYSVGSGTGRRGDSRNGREQLVTAGKDSPDGAAVLHHPLIRGLEEAVTHASLQLGVVFRI